MNRNVKKGLVLASSTLFAAWAGILGFMLAKQDRLTFPGSRTLVSPTPDVMQQAEAQLLSIPAEDGHSIQCFVVGDHDAKNILLAFPGNGGDALAYAAWLRRQLHADAPAASFRVIAPHYRGYGASGGMVNGPAMAEDAQLLARTLQPRAIFGRSFGAGMAALAAAAWPAPALIVSPWDSLARLARDYSRGIAPLRILKRFFRHEIGVDDIARQATSPVRCLVFSDDTVIRKERSRAFFDAWSGPKTWVELPGRHNENVGLSSVDAEFLLSALVTPYFQTGETR